MVQDQLFKGYQDFFGNFELQQPQRYKRILEDDGGDCFSHLNHAKLIMPGLFCQVVLLSPGGKRLRSLGFPYSLASPSPFFPPAASGCSWWVCASGQVGQAGWASCSRRYWLAVSCQQPGGEGEPCTDTASQKSDSEPFFSSDTYQSCCCEYPAARSYHVLMGHL